jgi:predicted phosphodiesterase
MAVQIISDLHLEISKAYDVFVIKPEAPYLALLGDIGNVMSDTDVRNDSSLGEFVLLDRTVYRMPDTNVVILGCSLFSSISAESYTAVSLGNDFLFTNDWDVNSHNSVHKRDIAWLNTQVAKLELSDVDIMIFTHWSPSKDPRTIDPRHGTSLITSAYSTDLSEEKCFKSKNSKIWAFGHTHFNCDVMFERNHGVGPIRLLTNQRGYYVVEAEGYDAEKTVNISADSV